MTRVRKVKKKTKTLKHYLKKHQICDTNEICDRYKNVKKSRFLRTCDKSFSLCIDLNLQP